MIAYFRKAVILVSAAAAAAVLPGQARAAGAAYAVDTAEVNEPGNCKVESWMSAASNHDFFAATVPTCVVNVFRPVEASVQIARSRADQDWTTMATPKLKTNLVPSAIGSWGVALSGAASYDLITHENTALFATITTDASCGAINGQHDSFVPIGGLVPLFNILRHENMLVNSLYRAVLRRVTWKTLDNDLATFLRAHPEGDDQVRAGK